jgi:WD40 repeat protein
VLENGYLASASEDTTLKIWDVNTGGLIKTLEGHTYGCFVLAVLHNGYLVSTGNDFKIKIWS